MVERHGSILDRKPSRIHNYPLTINQQIWLHFIVPGGGFCILYTLNFSLDLGLALDLLNQRKFKSGLATLCLMYLPAAIVYLREISIPPEPRDAKISTLWILKETAYLIFFPYRIIKCIGEQLFWIIEILKDEDHEEEALVGYEECFKEPSLTYLFTMIFLQNIPQAILQLYLLAINISDSRQTDYIQAVSVVVSIAMAAQGITTYHRYESQRLGGRTPVWSTTAAEEGTPPSTPAPGQLRDPLVPKSSEDLKLPTRKPRIRGLEEDSPIGKFLLYSFWFLFLLGRVITIVMALKFYPAAVCVVLVVHVALMFLYYVWYQTDIFTKIFLSLTSSFFIFEIGIQFRKVVYLYMLFIVSMMAEDIGLTILWFICGNWWGWWYNYAVYVSINAHFVSLIMFASYLVFYKPSPKYIDRAEII